MLVEKVHVLISKILIGFDDTECSYRALELGLDLAEKLCFCNYPERNGITCFRQPRRPFAASTGMAGFLKDLRKAHEDILKKAAQTAGNLKPNLKVAMELKAVILRMKSLPLPRNRVLMLL